ncbi:hypothetical protein, partial [Paenibacillus larvae]|uniref:hypothetical protein n=1 Tax=Paenibacillus larvae TaxID=1464 RepID=UPI00227FF4C4
MLAKRGFPVNVEEAYEDVQKIVSQDDALDTLMNVMQTMGMAITEIGEQNNRLNRHEESITQQSEQLDGQDGRIVELEKTLQELKRELDMTKKELAVTKEQANKSLWRRIFGK